MLPGREEENWSCAGDREPSEVAAAQLSSWHSTPEELDMAESNRTAVTIVAVLAMVILVGIVAYFVMEETDDSLEIDVGGQLGQDAPAQVVGEAA